MGKNSENAHRANMISPEKMKELLDSLYKKALNGIDEAGIKSAEDLSNEYLNKYKDRETAAKRLLNMQAVKCTTSGFITGLGGLITLPVAIPANLSSVLYVQMRMILCMAYIGGYEIEDDEVQTMTYACLAGVSVNEVLKQAGIKFGQKLTVSLIKKIPGDVLVKINQKVGFRLLTKFGEKGLINLGKMVPVVGGVIQGGLDLAETEVIGNRAYKWFIKNDFTARKTKKSEDVIVDIDESQYIVTE